MLFMLSVCEKHNNEILLKVKTKKVRFAFMSILFIAVITNLPGILN